jgi:hypothetical protein
MSHYFWQHARYFFHRLDVTAEWFFPMLAVASALNLCRMMIYTVASAGISEANHCCDVNGRLQRGLWQYASFVGLGAPLAS